MACHQQAILCIWDAVITCTSVTIISTWGVVMLDKKRPNRHEENSLTGRHTLWQNLSLACVHVQTVNTSTLLWFIERLKQLEAAKLLIDAVCAKAEGGGLISISMRACQDFSVIHIYCRCANKFILAHSHFWLLECDPGDLAVQLLHIPVLSCSKQTLCCGCSYFITTLEKLEWIYLAHTPGHTLSTCRHYT